MEQIKDQIVKGIKDNVDIAIIGLSGGADSLLCTLLSIDAVGKDNVYCYSMPGSKFDMEHFNVLSEDYAKHLKVNHNKLYIRSLSEEINEMLKFKFNIPNISNRVIGNIKSRLRMVLLYAASNILAEENKDKRVRVIGTGNFSEDYIGYDTKGGDALADIFPIGNLFKSEVYKLLEYYRDKNIITEVMINKKPSAGLWDDQTDENELGYTYNEMEPEIKYFVAMNKKYGIEEFNCDSKIKQFVNDRHLQNKHKHEKQFIINIER